LNALSASRTLQVSNMWNDKDEVQSATNAGPISPFASLVLAFVAMFATWGFFAKLLLGHF